MVLTSLGDGTDGGGTILSAVAAGDSADLVMGSNPVRGGFWRWPLIAIARADSRLSPYTYSEDEYHNLSRLRKPPCSAPNPLKLGARMPFARDAGVSLSQGPIAGTRPPSTTIVLELEPPRRVETRVLACSHVSACLATRVRPADDPTNRDGHHKDPVAPGSWQPGLGPWVTAATHRAHASAWSIVGRVNRGVEPLVHLARDSRRLISMQ